MSEARWLVGDVFERMAELPDASVDCIVTSPPFLALRSYLPANHPDKGKEIGSEATPAEFLSTLLALTREWRRLLAPHGSLCVELGDTYAGSGGAGGDYADGGLREGQPGFSGSASRSGWHRLGRRAEDQPSGYRKAGTVAATGTANGGRGWPLAKSLCLLPTLYPASLAYGRNLLDPADTIDPWRIRNLIVWHRPNPPVGALGDKVRPSTSYITTACVSPRRWFDLDAERHTNPRVADDPGGYRMVSGTPTHDAGPRAQNPAGAPPLDMWNIPTAPYSGSHYAVFPPALPRKLINLMCPLHVCTTCGEPRRRIVGEVEYVNSKTGKPTTTLHFRDGNHVDGQGNTVNTDGLGDRAATRVAPTLGWTDCACGAPFRRGHVLDPFAGSGITLAVATGLGRDATGIDIDERNLELARHRIGMFLTEQETPA